MTDDREVRRPRRTEVVLDLWVLIPVAVLCWPLLTRSGYPFSRDLVLTPRLPLRPEALGLGTGSPRAAPLDAVVAVLSGVVDGEVIGRVAVVGILAAAGWAAHRAVRGLGTPARALAAGLAVWNPFVVERLGLGQWALLAGYAAVLGVVAALRHDDDAPLRRAARLAPWLALGALTPTGALLVAATVVVLGTRTRRDLPAVVLGLLVQLPWLLPALLGSASGVSDPSAVTAFAARAERPGPALLSLVGLGGVWDGQSVPGSRTGWLGHATTAMVVVVLVVAARAGRATVTGSRRRTAVPRRLWWVGLGSLVVAALTTVPAMADLVASLTAHVPGLGLLRDAQKWMAPFVVLVVVSAAIAADAAAATTRRRLPVLSPTVLVLLVLAPFALLPDATVVVHRVLSPVTYPDDLTRAARAVEREPAVLASVPWRLYRQYPWAGPYATYDVASRWFDTRVVTSDDLVVGDQTIRGEDPYARRVGGVLGAAGPLTARDLAAEGVGWVLVARGDPEAVSIAADLTASPAVERVVEGEEFLLLRLPEPSRGVADGLRSPMWTVVLVAATDVVVALVLLVVSFARSSSVGRRRSVTVA